LGETLSGHDLVLVAGSSIFPYYPNIPGDFLADGTSLIAITSDPDEAARAPMGDAIVADVALTLRALVDALPGPAEREAPPARVELDQPAAGDELTGGEVHATLAELFPEDGIVVLESPSSTVALRNQLRLSRPGSYYFSASGGLGFGLSAALGVQLAQPQRQVVCVLGEGSAQYAITAFWTAAAYEIPVKFLVLRNNEYSILKWFASLENVTGAPALDLPRLDVAATARSYNVPATSVAGREELQGALADALAQDGPRLSRRPPLLAPDTRRIGRPSGPPARDRAPDELAAGTPEPLRGDLISLLGPERVLSRAIDLIAYASDASPYRRLPAVVVMAHDAADVGKVLDYARRSAVPVNFRGGGTSLNGQAQTDGIMIDVRRWFSGVKVEEGGARARLAPGAPLGLANRLLEPPGYKHVPHPASKDIATVGGVIANNSGGMRCGVSWDPYSTVESMTLVLASGTVIDTAAADGEARFAAAEPELAAGLLALREELLADGE